MMPRGSQECSVIGDVKEQMDDLLALLIIAIGAAIILFQRMANKREQHVARNNLDKSNGEFRDFEPVLDRYFILPSTCSK